MLLTRSPFHDLRIPSSCCFTLLLFLSLFASLWVGPTLSLLSYLFSPFRFFPYYWWVFVQQNILLLGCLALQDLSMLSCLKEIVRLPHHYCFLALMNKITQEWNLHHQSFHCPDCHTFLQLFIE